MVMITAGAVKSYDPEERRKLIAAIMAEQNFNPSTEEIGRLSLLMRHLVKLGLNNAEIEIGESEDRPGASPYFIWVSLPLLNGQVQLRVGGPPLTGAGVFATEEQVMSLANKDLVREFEENMHDLTRDLAPMFL